MASRLKLHEELKEILGNNNCYFQPPESVKLKYPCIVYEYENSDVQFANDKGYILNRRYSVTIMDKNPDTQIPDKLTMTLPMCISDRNFTSDNVYHYMYHLYY